MVQAGNRHGNGGVAPFIVLDLIKALIAATIVEGTRSLLLMNS